MNTDCYPNSWIALFSGLLDILLLHNNFTAVQQFLPTITALINRNKIQAIFNQMISTKDKSLLFRETTHEEIMEILRQFLFTQYRIRLPLNCNQEVLTLISRNFSVNLQFITPNLSIRIESSENYPQILLIKQEGSSFVYSLAEQQEQTNLQFECLGCLRLFDQKQVHKSVICHHMYCNQCLKFNFKIGNQFTCRDYFCQLRLSREDFPLFVTSPLQIHQNKCLRCRKAADLFVNRCGHAFCQDCINRKLQYLAHYQTLFCLEPTCTELLQLKAHCAYCSGESSLLPMGCQDSICRSCLESQYSELISHGLNHKVECPKCKKEYDMSKLYDSQFKIQVNRDIRSTSQQESKGDSASTKTITTSRVRTLSRSNYFEQPDIQTPRRALGRSYAGQGLLAPQFY